MPKIKIVSGKVLIRFFEKNGFKKVRQVGSHVVLTKKEKMLVIPLHKGKDLGRGIIAALLKDAGISRKEYEKGV